MLQMVRPPQMEQQLNVRQCTLVCEGVLALAISNVCYSRGLFEPDDFDDVKLFQGQPVQHKLKDNERTAELWRWLREGVNPALEKRYLDKVLFIISADKAGENVLEVFAFKCDYSEKPAYVRDGLRSTTKEGINRQASAMLAILSSYTESSAPLPSFPTFLRIELVYNERAPAGYTPAGELFTATHDVAGRTLKFVDETAVLDLMPVETPHQSIKTQLFTTSVNGMWESRPKLAASTLTVGTEPRAAAAHAAAAQGGSCSPTVGNAASQQGEGSSQLGGSEAPGGTSKVALYELGRRAREFCARLGAGQLINAKVLQEGVHEIKPLDACMILCQLEATGVISANVDGGRKVLEPPSAERSLPPGAAPLAPSSVANVKPSASAQAPAGIRKA